MAMPVTLHQFIERLTQSGLLTADELAAFQKALPADRQPHDGQALANELLQAHKLTRFQAEAVLQGKTKGLVFGEYVVLDKLGQGGMGVVLKARHRTMERLVALKVLASKAMTAPDAVKRFHREVTAAARLAHPNIVMAYDAGQYQGTN
jgi:eukaryotic-like serine/threonine-protein kinase